MRYLKAYFSAALTFGVVFSASARAIPIEVIAPNTGTRVSAGETVAFRISVTDPEIATIQIGGTLPIATYTESIPLSQYQVTVSPDASPGEYSLTAIGQRGGTSTSTTIRLIVEPSVGATEIRISPRQLLFRYPGQRVRLFVELRDSTGRFRTIQGSPDVEFTSTDNRVAYVGTGGWVVAASAGDATIQANFHGHVDTVSATVPSLIPGDLDGDADVDTDDLGEMRAFLNSPAGLPSGDARDLNSDERINALDTRLLALRCTRPRCSTY